MEALSMRTTTNFSCRLFKQSQTSLSWWIGLVCWNLNVANERCACYLHEILCSKDANTKKSNLIYNLQPPLSSSSSFSIMYLHVVGIIVNIYRPDWSTFIEINLKNTCCNNLTLQKSYNKSRKIVPQAKLFKNVLYCAKY